MSHLTRRGFITGGAAAVSAVAVPSLAPKSDGLAELTVDGYLGMSHPTQVEVQRWVSEHGVPWEDVFLVHLHGPPYAWHSASFYWRERRPFEERSARHALRASFPSAAIPRLTLHGAAVGLGGTQ